MTDTAADGRCPHPPDSDRPPTVPDCDELYRRHVAAGRAYARQFTYNSADAEDITSEAFVRIFKLMQRGLGPSPDGFRTYLRHTVRSCAVAHIKKREREYLADGSVLAALVGSDDLAAGADQQETVDQESMLIQAFGELSPRHRLVLLLTAVDGLQPAVVAMALNKTPNQLAAIAYRARTSLRSAIQRLAAQRPANTAGGADVRP